jgi:urea ABC transporter ATP-binding protein UrtE
MLRVEDLEVSFGGSLVLQGVNLAVEPGRIVALMGRNGMGKTTLLKTIIGQVRPRGGRIVFDGTDITGRPIHRIANSGVAYVPQGREIFGEFSVIKNLRLAMLRFPRAERRVPDEIYDYFPILRERAHQKAGSFSGGEQQMLAIARALVGRPKLLLLDEPSEGIQPSIVDQISDILGRINAETGLTILIVEQNVNMIEELTHDCSFIEKGRIVLTCPVDEIKADESIITRHMSV